ncbi:MAG: efflux RND transporter permease subunit [Planctomycetota bacterium]
MLTTVIRFSVRHHWLVLAAAFCLAGAGLVSLLQTPVDAVPDLSEKQVIVFAAWTGHGPLEIESQVTRHIARALQALPGVTAVRGSSDMGFALVHVIFDDSVPLSEARTVVQEQLAGLSLQFPPGVHPQLAADGIATGQIYWYTVESSQADPAELRRIQDEQLVPLLSTVPGVAEVASVGGVHAEVRIDADPAALIRRKLSLPELTRQLQAAHTAGGQVLQKEGAEYVLRLHTDPAQTAEDALEHWRLRVIRCADGSTVSLADLARVSLSAAPRRGAFEKDGAECVAGIVHMRHGGNVPEVTAAVAGKLVEIAEGLPSHVRIVPCYDRRPLIDGAVRTVTRTLLEALMIAAVCVLIVLRHLRSWLVIAVTLPMCVLLTFVMMVLLKTSGLLTIHTNIMSLAGIVISIGVLVDSSIVLTENVMHRLHQRFRDGPVHGDISEDVIAACSLVGRPVFFSILVMLVSFLPVFSLGGIDGRMYGPLAWTKSLALIAAAVLAVTLVPALACVLIRGRLREETESAVIRTLLAVYRPLLNTLLDRPLPLVVLLCGTLVLAAAPLGTLPLRCAVCLAVCGCAWTAGTWRATVLCGLGAVLLGTAAGNLMPPIGTSLRMPLDEGMVMDMPITIPRASMTQSLDDMKARNMVLCRFPEIRMVTGKAGRADTPFDPAPLDMIETMVEFLPAQSWPQRRLSSQDARLMTGELVGAMVAAGMLESVDSRRHSEFSDAALLRFDAVQRETAWQLQQAFRIRLRQRLGTVALKAAADRWVARGELIRSLQPADMGRIQNVLPVAFLRDLEMAPDLLTTASWLRASRDELRQRQLMPDLPVASRTSSLLMRLLTTSDGLTAQDAQVALTHVQRAADAAWSEFTASLNQTLRERSVPTFLHLVCDEIFAHAVVRSEDLRRMREQVLRIRSTQVGDHGHRVHEHGLAGYGELPFADPVPAFDELKKRIIDHWAPQVRLLAHSPETLTGFGGELDLSVQMPGWTNVWTRPIQNRVDMLATGINSEVGVRVLGQSLEDVIEASEDVAAILRELPGAADVVADPIRGKGTIEVIPDDRRAAALQVSLEDLSQTAEHLFTGRIIAATPLQSSSLPVRLSLVPVAESADEQTLRRIPVLAGGSAGAAAQTWDSVPLDAVAEVRSVEGPATVKSDNGWLRNYVRLNVRERDPQEFVEQAQRVVAGRLRQRPGIVLEWTGQFQHAARAKRRMLVIVPATLALIFLILLWTYRDPADALIMLLTAPGALAGGVLCQWLLGYPFSVAVGVGYIACFGMAASTGVVMLVYLRDAVDAAGGLTAMTPEQLRQAVFRGAVQRLRPKLLTEATTLLSLAPVLWSTGAGADVIRPMVAPVLGGVLIADEIIDLLLPILFYQVRLWRLKKQQQSIGSHTRQTSSEKNIPEEQ